MIPCAAFAASAGEPAGDRAAEEEVHEKDVYINPGIAAVAGKAECIEWGTRKSEAFRMNIL